MYIKYFKFQEEPFNLTPDPKFLYLSKELREIISRIQYGIEMRKGVMLLMGEVGVGKTTIIQSIIAQKSEKQKIALIVNPRIIGSNLLQNICREFGIELDFKGISKSDILNLLYDYVLKKSLKEQNFILIVDDAHDLNNEQFQDLLFLSKLETNTQKLIQIVIVGLPVLVEKLNVPLLLSLKQQIQIKQRIHSLSYADTQNFIHHRLAKAGYERRDIFKAEALQRIFQFSEGVPRTISVIASNALLYAYLNGMKKIDYPVIDLVTDESLQEIVEDNQEEQSFA